MGIVAITKCSTYEAEMVYNSVKKVIDDIGGIGKYLKKGDRVLIKPNLLMKRRPEEATTTHPMVVEAVTRVVMEAGGIVTIADSPGGPFSVGILKALYDTCGMSEVAKSTGAQLGLDTSFRKIAYDEGKMCHGFDIVSYALDADVVISVAKLKTHMMSYMTGSVKNLFGVIPGTYKAEYHFRIPDKKMFCEMLLDLCECVKPSFGIVDAIDAMEGDGPSSGEVKKVGAIVGGENLHELDYTLSKIMNIGHEQVFTLSNAIERGLLNPQNIELIGEMVVVKDFKMPSVRHVHFAGKGRVRKLIDPLITPKPKANKKKCIGCGKCAEGCPPKVIDMKDRLPVINYEGCIKCYCCHELCPVKAMEIKRPFLLNSIIKLLH